MNIYLRLFLFIVISLFFVTLIMLLRKNRLNLKYTLLWFFLAVVMYISILFPGIFLTICKIIGIASPVSLIFTLEGIFVLIILLSLTVIMSHMNNRIYKLIQKQAIIEKRLNDIMIQAQTNQKEEELEGRNNNVSADK